MRLLTYDESGSLVLRIFDSDTLPAYAILSHTWLENNTQEVTFQDLEAGLAISKPGYAKLQFCGKRAMEDGLQYFWVDTCCINKNSDPELSEAINSMYRWYHQATRCYVYLADISIRADGTQKLTRNEWQPFFQRSRWFTRGWTLQELLAPGVVEFYTRDEDWLGDKSSLEHLLCDITSIDLEALRGSRLDSFGFEEKMRWAAGRNTKRAEDGIYSMLGIFDVSMPLVYGEGRENALRRLRREIDDACAGAGLDDYSVNLNLARIPNIAKFVGRESELSKMHKLLYDPDQRSVAVLHGLGGIGKTQLAVTYLRQHKAKYSAIFWIDADSDDSIRSSFRSVAQWILEQHPSTVQLSSVDLEGDPGRIIEAVLSWLSLTKNRRWLLVYDNYDNPKIPGQPSPNAVNLRTYLPQCDHGSILITTRSSQVTLGRRIHVRKLSDVQEGISLLSHTSQRVGIEDDPAAIALVEELDGLPLALSTAGAYLEQVATSFAEYHRMYKDSWLDLQKQSPQLDSYEERSLYTTWQLSLGLIQRQDESAAKLLKLWAYFDRQDVWYELLRPGTTCEWLVEMTASRASFDQKMRLLCSYGLVEPDAPSSGVSESSGYSVHSCVHAWMISVLNDNSDYELARLALLCVAKMVPLTSQQEWWTTQSRLLLHAARCCGFIEDEDEDISGMEWALECVGILYVYQGKLDEAEKMYTRALQGKEETLGSKHASTLETVNSLGNLYILQDKLNEAEKMYTRALQGKEETLGSKHVSTLETVNSLGILYKEQGKLEEAEKMYTRAIQGYEEAIRLTHPSTLDTINNLGVLHKSQGKPDEAEKSFTRAPQGYEATGLNQMSRLHTSILPMFTNLGKLYMQQGKFNEAEKMYMRALQGYEESVGTELMETYIPALNTLFAMGNLLFIVRPREAREWYTRALQGFTIVYGASSGICLDIEQCLAEVSAAESGQNAREIPQVREVDVHIEITAVSTPKSSEKAAESPPMQKEDGHTANTTASTPPELSQNAREPPQVQDADVHTADTAASTPDPSWNAREPPQVQDAELQTEKTAVSAPEPSRNVRESPQIAQEEDVHTADTTSGAQEPRKSKGLRKLMRRLRM